MQLPNRTQSESATQRGAIKKLHCPLLATLQTVRYRLSLWQGVSLFFRTRILPQMISQIRTEQACQTAKNASHEYIKLQAGRGGGSRTERDMPETSQSRVDWESLGYIKRQQCDEAQSEIKRVTLQGLKCFFHRKETKKIKSKENKFIFQGIFHAVERSEGYSNEGWAERVDYNVCSW